MISLLVRVAVFLAEAAIGILAASLLLSGFHVQLAGFMVAIVVFAVVQSLVAAAAGALSRKYAPSLVALVGLVSTFVSLLAASLLVEGGITIDGVVTWILATLLVWAVSALASWGLRKFIVKEPGRS